MVKIFNWFIISSDEYNEQVDNYEKSIAALTDDIIRAKGGQKDAEKRGAKLLKQLCTAEAERDKAQEELADLQAKAFIRGEKGRFVRYLKTLTTSIADEKDSAN